MWRTLAGGLALALMAIGGPVVNAAGTTRPAAGHAEKTLRKETSAHAKKTAWQASTGDPDAAPAGEATDRTQPPPGDGAAGSAPIGANDGAATQGVQPTRNQPEMLNRAEMLSLVRRYASEIAESLVDGEQRRERAVRQKDSIKLACIQDRLSNMKLMKRMADERLAATARPTVRQDELSLLHEFRGVEMAHKRVAELRQELNECVGESLEVTEPSGTLPTSVDPSPSNAEIPRMERPTPASLYQ